MTIEINGMAHVILTVSRFEAHGAGFKSLTLLSSATRVRFRLRHRPFSSGGEKGSKCPIAAVRKRTGLRSFIREMRV